MKDKKEEEEEFLFSFFTRLLKKGENSREKRPRKRKED